MRRIGNRIFSVAMMTIMTVSLFAGVPAKGLSKVQAATVLSNPRKSDSGIATWDCVYFGRYPQSDAKGLTKEAIKWRVLSTDGKEAYLVADCNLDVQQYDPREGAYDGITWETSTLRSWLNGYNYTKNASKRNYTKGNFINRAFTEKEQNAIKSTTVKPDASNGGNSTVDKVFLLSLSDATNPNYGFSNNMEPDNTRVRLNTAYVAAGGSTMDYSDQYNVYTNGAGEANWWWLRTPGIFTNNAYYVGTNGVIDSREVNTGKHAICPALYLDLSKSDLWSYAGTVSSDGSSTPGEEPPKVDGTEPTIEDPETGATYTPTEPEQGSTGEKKETVEFVAPDKETTEVEVPSEVTISGITYKVTSIADNAFKNNKKLKKIVINDNITSIGKNAFYGCKNLETVKFGKNVTLIGEKAFYKCTKLKKITIPSKVTTIGASAFYGCTKLAKVSLGKNVTSIGAKAFYNCKSLKKITIPSKVNYIGKQAFYNCKSMKTVTIKTKELMSSNVGSKAFKGVYSKATYKVPKSKLSAYKSLLKKKGVSTKAKIKRY